ncbi:MAG: aromatic ring-hydroxylating dioxygenase subunit alpha [Spirochaetia bacterium]|nr:aromatic ring-hydroxylating dioxygenase subunit alpha [Spirochaetia bacterium]
MIPNQWYVVLESWQLKDRPLGVTRLGEKLVFYRTREGKPVCLADKCAHRGVALSIGKLCEHDTIQCPFHGLEYDPAGKCTVIPANGKSAPVPPNFKVHSYPAFEDHGFIWIWWGDSAPSPEKPEFFDDIPEEAKYANSIDHWNAHYSRVIENQLDCVHLPFVHYNTIGRGNRTLVNGPGIEWVHQNKFFMYVYNEVDRGQTPKKILKFRFPLPIIIKSNFSSRTSGKTELTTKCALSPPLSLSTKKTPCSTCAFIRPSLVSRVLAHLSRNQRCRLIFSWRIRTAALS